VLGEYEFVVLANVRIHASPKSQNQEARYNWFRQSGDCMVRSLSVAGSFITFLCPIHQDFRVIMDMLRCMAIAPFRQT
jgi:hypothetical protein